MKARKLADIWGVQVIEESDSLVTLNWILTAQKGGEQRRVLMLERYYREGVCALADPTDEELTACCICGWSAWNNDRAEWL